MQIVHAKLAASPVILISVIVSSHPTVAISRNRGAVTPTPNLTVSIQSHLQHSRAITLQENPDPFFQQKANVELDSTSTAMSAVV